MTNKNGTLTKLKNGKFKAIWKFSDGSTKTKTTKYKREAREWLDTMRAKYGDGNDKDRYLTLNNVYELYFEEKKRMVNNNILKASTLDRYNQTFENHILNSDLGNIKLSELTPRLIEDFCKTKLDSNLSYSTTYKHIESLIKILLGYAYQKDWLKKPIHKQVKRPPKRLYKSEDIIPLTENELKKLTDCSLQMWEKKQGRYNLGYILMAMTGMRVGELLALTWDDVDMTKEEININKSYSVHMDFNTNKRKQINFATKTPNSDRIVGLNNSAVWLLNQLQERNSYVNINSPYVICSNSGQQIKTNVFRRTCERLFKTANIETGKVFLHRARHTYASMLINNDVSTNEISQALGHSNISTTENYTHTDLNKKIEREKNYNFFNLLDNKNNVEDSSVIDSNDTEKVYDNVTYINEYKKNRVFLSNVK